MSTPDSEPTKRFVALLVTEEEINALIPLIGQGKPGVLIDDLPPLSRVALRITAAALAEPGECMICGCTDDDGYPVGCSWVNKERTLCSACLEGDRG